MRSDDRRATAELRQKTKDRKESEACKKSEESIEAAHGGKRKRKTAAAKNQQASEDEAS
jgi:hypothetical protein